ncbi:MAG: ribonuclease III domain-containing protein [Sulfobacillus sp.]
MNHRSHDVLGILRASFGLDVPPFDDIDDDFLWLALTPACHASPLSKRVRQRIFEKYGTCDHQVLEFYGDRILYGIAAMLSYRIFGVGQSLKLVEEFIKTVTSNRSLTDLMVSKNACRLVQLNTTFFLKPRQRIFHNRCADTFEALLAALSIHLEKKGLPVQETLLDWMLRRTNLPHVVQVFLTNKAKDNLAIYSPNDRKQMVARLNAERRSEALEFLELPEIQAYPALQEELLREEELQLQDFADRAVLISAQDSRPESVYRALGWGQPDLSFSELEIWSYRHGTMVLGTGFSPEEAWQNARQFLVSLGYVIFYEPSALQFVLA